MELTKYAVGIFLLVLVSVIWVAASHLIKGIFEGDFEKPVFLTYFNTCGFSLWLCGGYCSGEWRRDLPCDGDEEREREGFGGYKSYLRVAVVFAPIWFLANFAFNLSLTSASVASNSILSNTSSLWTMILSSIVLNEQIGFIKIVAVLFTIAGVALVAFTEPSSPDKGDSKSGDALALFSACCHACYTVLLRLRLPDSVHMPIFFGYVGLVTLIVGLPLLLLLDFAGIETLAVPSGKTLTLLIINAVIGTNISDVLWAKAVLLTSPVIATIGLSLTIPFGMISDILLSSKQFSILYTVGALFVLTGFILINSAEWVAVQMLTLVNKALGIRQPPPEVVPTEASEEELQCLTDRSDA